MACPALLFNVPLSGSWTFDKVQRLGKGGREKREERYILWLGEAEPQYIAFLPSPFSSSFPSEDGQGPFVKSPVPGS